jgi:DNA-binding CsgD family transcriptional regulator
MIYGLTDAEAAVAARIIEGADVAGVAAATGRSAETVRSHLRAVYGKLGIGQRTELVQIARALTPPVAGPDPGAGV